MPETVPEEPRGEVDGPAEQGSTEAKKEASDAPGTPEAEATEAEPQTLDDTDESRILPRS